MRQSEITDRPALGVSERTARGRAALGAVTIAFSSILVELSHASAATTAIFRCAYALPVLGLLAWREARRYGARALRDRVPAAVAGVFFAIDLILWARSIQDVGAGLATVLANVQVVLVPLVAWLVLRERPSRRVRSAVPVALAGVLLISGALERHAYGADPAAGAAFGLAAGLSYSGFLLLLRRGGGVDLRRPAGTLFDATAVGVLSAALIGVVFGGADFVPSWPSAGWLVLLALNSQVLGWLLITTSLPRLPAATTSLILMIQPIGSMILGAIIFAERPTALQITGVVLVLAAVLYATRASSAAAVVVAAPGSPSEAGTDAGATPVLSETDPARALG
jgi:drug/metabolite transporter (DMT)-like permease